MRRAVQTPSLLVLGLASVLAGCQGGAGSVGTDGGLDGFPTLAADVQPIFDRSCVSGSCHGSDNPRAFLSLSLGRSHDYLVGQESHLVEGATLVEPGRPERSLLMAVLRGEVDRDPDDGRIDRMPPRRPALPRDDIETIERWIAAGAPH